ncbi:MAG: glucose-1-phosphate thymidylyltransferase RfbA [Legionellaceae bacterium]|nr:glucose-1-phosphate thymidylyltransferase RfbA [Legionellaceae bacterium]
MIKQRKGIVLAGGLGTRLYPITLNISKQMLPIYDKPMVFYPISVLMLAGIREILIISTPRDLPIYQNLLGDGSKYGVEFSYIEQPSPDGLAQAFILGESFINQDNCCLILGDNVFYGPNFSDILKRASAKTDGATIFGYHVADPYRFGVVELNSQGKVISIEEKPAKPKSNYVITGLYFYDNHVIDIAKNLKPSARGELEITDVNKIYLNENFLEIELLGRDNTWLDTGTHETLLEASQFMHTLEKRQGLKVACLEEVAYRSGWITSNQLESQTDQYRNTPFGDYLHKILKES